MATSCHCSLFTFSPEAVIFLRPFLILVYRLPSLIKGTSSPLILPYGRVFNFPQLSLHTSLFSKKEPKRVTMYTRGRGRSVTSTEWGCRRWYRAGDDVVVWERNTDGTPYGMATYRCLIDRK